MQNQGNSVQKHALIDLCKIVALVVFACSLGFATIGMFIFFRSPTPSSQTSAKLARLEDEVRYLRTRPAVQPLPETKAPAPELPKPEPAVEAIVPPPTQTRSAVLADTVSLVVRPVALQRPIVRAPIAPTASRTSTSKLIGKVVLVATLPEPVTSAEYKSRVGSAVMRCVNANRLDICVKPVHLQDGVQYAALVWSSDGLSQDRASAVAMCFKQHRHDGIINDARKYVAPDCL